MFHFKASSMKLPFVGKYLPVSQKDVVDGSQDLEEGSNASSSEYGSKEKPFTLTAKPSKLSLLSRWAPWLLCLCLFISNIQTWRTLNQTVFKHAVYSPAVPALEWKNVLWEAAVQDEMTEYQGVPNAKNNKLWNELFVDGITKINMDEASQLYNRTSPIDNEGNYVVTLDVFHQLHCLNKMRQKIYWNSTNYGEPEPEYINTAHVDHCIDQLRQSLMCTVDITPIPYQWYPKYAAYLPSTGIVHQCRNFEAVKEWAKPRRVSEKWDIEKKLTDPLGDQLHVYKDWWCKENGGCEWSPESDHHTQAAKHPHSSGGTAEGHHG